MLHYSEILLQQIWNYYSTPLPVTYMKKTAHCEDATLLDELRWKILVQKVKQNGTDTNLRCCLLWNDEICHNSRHMFT